MARYRFIPRCSRKCREKAAAGDFVPCQACADYNAGHLAGLNTARGVNEFGHREYCIVWKDGETCDCSDELLREMAAYAVGQESGSKNERVAVIAYLRGLNNRPGLDANGWPFRMVEAIADHIERGEHNTGQETDKP